jgi:hypothetical protein
MRGEVERFNVFPVCYRTVTVATSHVKVKSEGMTDCSCLPGLHTAKPSYETIVNGQR